MVERALARGLPAPSAQGDGDPDCHLPPTAPPDTRSDLDLAAALRRGDRDGALVEAVTRSLERHAKAQGAEVLAVSAASVRIPLVDRPFVGTFPAPEPIRYSEVVVRDLEPGVPRAVAVGARAILVERVAYTRGGWA